jgi:hypothetical protein
MNYHNLLKKRRMKWIGRNWTKVVWVTLAAIWLIAIGGPLRHLIEIKGIFEPTWSKWSPQEQEISNNKSGTDIPLSKGGNYNPHADAWDNAFRSLDDRITPDYGYSVYDSRVSVFCTSAELKKNRIQSQRSERAFLCIFILVGTCISTMLILAMLLVKREIKLRKKRMELDKSERLERLKRAY